MWTRLKSLQFSKKTIPWAFVLITILAYGLLTPWLGFYWDDWVFVWLLEHRGPLELARSFLPYDPLVSPFFLLSSSILGTHPFAWQVFGLAVRALVGLAALWTFNQIWPRYSRKVVWAGLLFLVYPGYGQQWVAFTHANQEWISFGFFVLSLGLTAHSLRDPRRKWTVYALLAQFVGLTTTEYFLGMEFLRPVMIWLMLDEPAISRRLKATLKIWVLHGYALLWLLAGIGQYLFHNSELYGGHGLSGGLTGDIPGFALNFLKVIIPTLRVAAFDVWTRTFDLITGSLSSLTDWLTLAIILLSLMGLILYLHGLQVRDRIKGGQDSWAIQAIVLGLTGIVGGRIPSYIAGMPFEIRFDWDRLLISVLFGASLLTAGLIDYLFKEDRRKEIFISLIIALAIGMQFQQSNSFRRDWENQKSFFWQLAWRAPALKAGTALVTDELPLQYEADLQLFRAAEPALRAGCIQALVYASLHENPSRRLPASPSVSRPAHAVPVSHRRIRWQYLQHGDHPAARGRLSAFDRSELPVRGHLSGPSGKPDQKHRPVQYQPGGTKW